MRKIVKQKIWAGCRFKVKIAPNDFMKSSTTITNLVAVTNLNYIF